MQNKDPIHDKVRANAEVMEQLNKGLIIGRNKVDMVDYLF